MRSAQCSFTVCTRITWSWFSESIRTHNTQKSLIKKTILSRQYNGINIHLEGLQLILSDFVALKSNSQVPRVSNPHYVIHTAVTKTADIANVNQYPIKDIKIQYFCTIIIFSYIWTLLLQHVSDSDATVLDCKSQAIRVCVYIPMSLRANATF